MIRAIVFDCVGVLLSYGFYASFVSLGGDPEADKAFLKDLFGFYNAGVISDDEFLIRLSKHLNVTRDQVTDALAKDEHLNFVLFEYIKTLRKNYKIGVLSNIGKGGFERYFKDVNTKELFDDVVLSGEVSLVKPDPKIYKLSAERLEAEPQECVFVDDAKVNCTAAEEAGMQAVVYNNPHQFKQDLDKILNHT